jgi:hypothetical protein
VVWCARSEGEELERQDGDREHQRRQRHREVLGVAHAEVSGQCADEVEDQPGRGGDAERLGPQSDEDAGGAGELEGREDGEGAGRDADGAA